MNKSLNSTGTPGRNDPCPCGSGKKYKKCHGITSIAATVPGGQEKFETAYKLFEGEQFSEALPICLSIIQNNPKSADALQLAGIIESQIGRLEEAHTHLALAAKIEPKNPWIHNNLAHVDCRLGKFSDAIRHGKMAVKLDSRMPDAWNNLGNALREAGDFDESLAAYDRALSLFGKHPEVLCNIAMAMEGLNRNNEAEETYRKVIAIDPGAPRAFNQLGLLLTRMQRYDDAEEVFNSGLSSADSDADILNNLGLLKRKQEDPEAARNYFQRACQADPEYAGAYVNLGDLDFAEASFADAISHYQKALQRNHMMKEAHCHLADAYRALHDFESAEKHYLQALQLDEFYYDAILGFTGWFLDQEAPELALTVLTRAESLPDLDVERKIDVLLKQAEAYNIEKRYRLAVESAQKALTLDPDSIDVQTSLLDIYSSYGFWDRGEKIINRLIELAPDNIGVLIQLANVYERKNELEKSKALIEQILALKPDATAPRVLQAKILRREKHLEEAMQLISEVESRLPTDCHTDACKNLLNEKGNILDKMGRYDEAFDHYRRAAKIRSEIKHGRIPLSELINSFRKQIEFFSKEKLENLPVYDFETGDQKRGPIFIVGHPRSGTTLLEQILASHPHIEAGDELPFMHEIKEMAEKDLNIKKGYPLYLDAMIEQGYQDKNQDQIRAWREYYFSRADELEISKKIGAIRFTDKMPSNLLVTPLIRMIFPESPIIHIVRHPMDSCLSSMFSNFAKGHSWCNDINDAANYYRATTELATHLKNNMKMNYFEIRYEDLVDDQEHWSRKVIEFVGEVWDDKVLSFHETRRLARTASYEQVTKKIYTSSRFRYKNYERHLGQALEILRPAIEYYGYEV
ncbi:MAG: hypothetical protein AMS22_13290 [Thiotrichales bacterium SG8_50]|nr:MAG: hypothetical protein AMS22_13290 [Thiotrichales bacterium SG8_50]